MTFMSGKKAQLHVLEQEHVLLFTRAVNAGLTTQHLFTGSIPMRTADYWERWEEERKQGAVQFAVYVKDKGKLFYVGTCGLHSFKDVYHTCEFRILIFDPKAVGKGLGQEVTSLLLDYAFQRMNMRKVWLGVNEANVRAVKCYKSVGFKIEGVQREEIYCFGEYHDILHMGILRSEWQSTGT